MNVDNVKFEGKFLENIQRGLLSEWHKHHERVNIAEYKQIFTKSPQFITHFIEQTTETIHASSALNRIQQDNSESYFEIQDGEHWHLIKAIRAIDLTVPDFLTLRANGALDKTTDYQLDFVTSIGAKTKYPHEWVTTRQTPKAPRRPKFTYPPSETIETDEYRTHAVDMCFVVGFRIPRFYPTWREMELITDNSLADGFPVVEPRFGVGVYHLTMFYRLISCEFLNLITEE